MMIKPKKEIEEGHQRGQAEPKEGLPRKLMIEIPGREELSTVPNKAEESNKIRTVICVLIIQAQLS